MNCNTCNKKFISRLCPDCEQTSSLKRIDKRYIIHEIEHIVHLEKGIFYTIKELIINPGQNVKNYLTQNRSKLVKPIVFLIITSIIYSFSDKFFKFEYRHSGTFEKSNYITSWIQSNTGWANVIKGIPTALWVNLFFRKYKFNIYEIFVLFCYITGVNAIILSIFGILKSLLHFDFLLIGVIIILIYSSWGIGQFFEKSKAFNYILAFFAYILGLLTFNLALYTINFLF